MENAAYDEAILAALSEEQRRVLRRHAIAPYELFDALGYSQREYREQMSLHSKTLAFNVSMCRRGHHSLRTSGGHCVQCSPASLAFQERHRVRAFVYIAGSQEQRILKVGFSYDPDARIEHLNRLNYAARDWHLLLQVRCNRAGAVEDSLLGLHRQFSVFGEYWKDRRYQRCFELLRCDYRLLHSGLCQLVGRAIVEQGWERANASNDYKFG
jgi:hypothetical protein